MASCNGKETEEQIQLKSKTPEYCSYPSYPFDGFLSALIDTEGFKTGQLEQLKEALGTIRGIKHRAIKGASNVTDASEFYDIDGAPDLVTLLLDLAETIEKYEHKIVARLIDRDIADAA